MRNWGFRHSSTDGRFIDKNVPLAHSSWLNRPYHIDWFIGPMLSDNLDGARVSQSNDLFGGLRAGWDFEQLKAEPNGGFTRAAEQVERKMQMQERLAERDAARRDHEATLKANRPGGDLDK